MYSSFIWIKSSMVAYRCHKEFIKFYFILFFFFFFIFFFLFFFFFLIFLILFYFKKNFIWKQINVKTKWNDIKNKWKQNQNYLWAIAAIRIFFRKSKLNLKTPLAYRCHRPICIVVGKEDILIQQIYPSLQHVLDLVYEHTNIYIYIYIHQYMHIYMQQSLLHIYPSLQHVLDLVYEHTNTNNIALQNSL
jgi:hypothetical protein